MILSQASIFHTHIIKTTERKRWYLASIFQVTGT